MKYRVYAYEVLSDQVTAQWDTNDLNIAKEKFRDYVNVYMDGHLAFIADPKIYVIRLVQMEAGVVVREISIE